MKYDTKVCANQELIVNICILEKMRIAALISIKISGAGSASEERYFKTQN